MDIYVGLSVVRSDNPDRDACDDDYPFLGVVTGFSTERFGAAVVVRHGDYEERIARDRFWTVYRAA
jgi:hypothetical protein